MTREKALETMQFLYEHLEDVGDAAIFTAWQRMCKYVEDSIPTPTVEVVSKRGEYWDVNVNGEYVFQERYDSDAEMTASMLRAALEKEVQP